MAAGVLIAWLALDGFVFLDIVLLGPDPMEQVHFVYDSPADWKDVGMTVYFYEHVLCWLRRFRDVDGRAAGPAARLTADGPQRGPCLRAEDWRLFGTGIPLRSIPALEPPGELRLGPRRSGNPVFLRPSPSAQRVAEASTPIQARALRALFGLDRRRRFCCERPRG